MNKIRFNYFSEITTKLAIVNTLCICIRKGKYREKIRTIHSFTQGFCLCFTLNHWMWDGIYTNEIKSYLRHCLFNSRTLFYLYLMYQEAPINSIEELVPSQQKIRYGAICTVYRITWTNYVCNSYFRYPIVFCNFTQLFNREFFPCIQQSLSKHLE